MLATSKMTAILPVGDLGRARVFYGEVLGLEELGTTPDGKLQFGAGGGILALIRKENPVPAQHTAVSFEVESVEEAIRGLERRGVAFEDYDLPGLKTVNHVCVLGAEKAAWFKDPDGNVLCVHQTLA